MKACWNSWKRNIFQLSGEPSRVDRFQRLQLAFGYPDADALHRTSLTVKKWAGDRDQVFISEIKYQL